MLTNHALPIVMQAIDIVLVSYVVYQLLIFVKGTSTFQMIRGFVLIFLLTVGARLFHLSVLEWLLRSFWAVSLVVCVIVFQPEIRKMFMEMGRRRISNTLLRTEMLDELVKAVNDFSAKRIGALIVFEGDIGLKNYTSVGINIDSQISWELLETIFMPHSPLHDGAVIIRGNTIAAAACFLPLSKKELPKSMGTRHRAALGITERSDALVVIVSEETGTVSLVNNGHIRSAVTDDQIRHTLETYYGKRSKNIFVRIAALFTRKNLAANALEKLLAVLFGVAVWYYVKYAILK